MTYVTLWTHPEFGEQKSVYYTAEASLDWQQYIEYVFGYSCILTRHG